MGKLSWIIWVGGSKCFHTFPYKREADLTAQRKGGMKMEQRDFKMVAFKIGMVWT